MKRNIIYIILIIILTIIIALSTYIVLRKKDDTTKDYNILEVKEEKVIEHDSIFYSKYSDKIIYDNTLDIEYSIVKDSDVLYGNIYIDNNNLYIYDEINNNIFLVLDNVKTIITNEKDVRAKFEFYAITNLGELYKITINGTNVLSNSYINIVKLELPSKVNNFVDVSINSLIDDIYKGVVVILDNGIMYHADTITQYEEDTINVFDKYIIYSDKEITDFNRKILKDSNNINYIVKTVIVANEVVEKLEDNFGIFIITNDNKLIYLNKEGKVIEYKKVIKSISKDSSIIKLNFIDDTSIEILYFIVKDF